jgi:3-mercaptopyruvate sulfurtransferase SseA
VREATSARVAHVMRENGFDAYVLVGGLRAWEKAGYDVERVPETDLVLLPSFAARPERVS